MLPAAELRIDGGTQMRAAMDAGTVAEYAEIMVSAGGWGPFPPAEAVYDGSDYWMWKGNHRHAALLAAAKQFGTGFNLQVPVIVRPGTLRDAILEALGDNAEHGLRRTVEDKRKAVDWALADPELSQWSNAKIAAKCRVSAPFVGERRELMQRRAALAGAANPPATTRKYIDKHGREKVMNVGGIAASNQARAASASTDGGVRTSLPTCDTNAQELTALEADALGTSSGQKTQEHAASVEAATLHDAEVKAVRPDWLREQFLAILDGLEPYVQLTNDTAGAELLRRSLLAALDRLSAL
jgi:hypothetical protein